MSDVGSKRTFRKISMSALFQKQTLHTLSSAGGKVTATILQAGMSGARTMLPAGRLQREAAAPLRCPLHPDTGHRRRGCTSVADLDLI
jgi:hypothetical protein